MPSERPSDFPYGSRFDRVWCYVMDRGLSGMVDDTRRRGILYVVLRLRGWLHKDAVDYLDRRR